MPSTISPEATREQRRALCRAYGHDWTVFGAPAGTIVCRCCARWDLDPLWDDDDEAAPAAELEQQLAATA